MNQMMRAGITEIKAVKMAVCDQAGCRREIASTPYDLARRVYETEPCARSFEEDVFLHLQHGYVIARPDAFAMARPVWRHWSYKELASPWIVAPEGDCWWIWLLAGNMSAAMKWLPDAHRPWVGYERVNVPRFVRRERLIRG